MAHFEISVALNHDVDDLLVGIVAEIKDSFIEEKVIDENKEVGVNFLILFRFFLINRV